MLLGSGRRAALLVAALVCTPVMATAQSTTAPGDPARAADAERRLATSDLAAGRVAAAVAHLERARAATERSGRRDASVLAALALAYARLGQSDAFAVVGDQALQAGATGSDADAIRERLARLDAERGVLNGERRAPTGDPMEAADRDSAWAAYRRGAFDDAAHRFAAIAATAQSPLRRSEARLMAAQAHLEVGHADSARIGFVAAADSSRAAQQAVARFDSTVTASATTLVSARAFALLSGDAAATGRLLVAHPDTVRALTGAPALHVSTWSDLAALETAMGRAADAGWRAAVRLPATADTLVRARAIALRESDARVARARESLDEARAVQAARMLSAERLVRDIEAMRDSMVRVERFARALSDSLTRRDSSIALTVRAYRATLLAKIEAVRSLARVNARRVDSLVSASRQLSPEAASVSRDEMATAGSYVQVAAAAEAALDSGLVRQPVLMRRDSIQARLAAIFANVMDQRAAQESALAAAQQSLQQVTDQGRKRDETLSGELRARAVERDSLTRLAVEAVSAELKARVTSWRAALARALEAAEFGEAESQFFLAMAPSATATVRDAAINALTDVATRYAESPARPRAVLGLGELLARKADADYAAAQRGGGSVERPDYAPAMARLDEFLAKYPTDAEADAAAYTLGVLAFGAQRWADAAKAFERVAGIEGSPFRAESWYRLGETRFEAAIRAAGDTRRSMLAQASTAYDKAIGLSAADGDIHYLAMYKLGWSSYVQAERQSSDEYKRAVDVFAKLVADYDRLPRDRQARLALRDDAVDYMAIALTQIGGATDAIQYLSTIPDLPTRLLVLRRTARALREQGEFASAALAFRAAVDQAPLDTAALESQSELVDLYQNRMLEQERAQQARLQLVEAYGPTAAWGKANPGRAATAAVLREHMLRDAAQFELARAPKGGRPVFATAAGLLDQYQREFATTDSAPRMNALLAEALFGAGNFARAGAEYSKTAGRVDSATAAVARRNALVAFDSAFVRATADRGAQDSLFAAADRFVDGAADADARGAIIAKGRRASEAQRWSVMAESFALFARRWPADAFAPDARKLTGDARFRLGAYDVAQGEWSAAQRAATTAGRKAFADSIVSARIGAAARVADSLVARGESARAADSIYAMLAHDIGESTRAADLIRNAIEVHLAADSVARQKSDTVASRLARRGAVERIGELAQSYPNYQHTFTYRTIRARLLSDLGDGAASVDQLRDLIAANPQWPGRADAMVRRAVLLDSLGRRGEAAQAYEQMSAAYPQDRRAADAQFNAAVTYGESKDPAGAARAFATFAQRFPRDPRLAEAQRLRIEQLTAGGDTLTASVELTRACAKPSGPLVERCASRAAEQAYREGMALWSRYESMALVIASRADLTRAGVDKAAAPKQQLLRQMGQVFGRAIASGAPEWLSAASFQTGLAQWMYGVFLRDVQLPAELTESQKSAAQRGSAQQAQQYFDAARTTWQALVEKAEAGKFENTWVQKAKDALDGKGVPPRG